MEVRQPDLSEIPIPDSDLFDLRHLAFLLVREPGQALDVSSTCMGCVVATMSEAQP
jgi:hypothetical protein